jgi:hypothetical protein
MKKILKILNKITIFILFCTIIYDLYIIKDCYTFFILIKTTILLIIHTIMFGLCIKAEVEIDNR